MCDFLFHCAYMYVYWLLHPKTSNKTCSCVFVRVLQKGHLPKWGLRKWLSEMASQGVMLTHAH